MIYFAQLENNKVINVWSFEDEVVLDENGNQDLSLGMQWLPEGQWIEASDTTVIGQVYVESADAFVDVQPYDSWTINETTLEWEAPVAQPDDSLVWSEELQEWTEEETQLVYKALAEVTA